MDAWRVRKIRATRVGVPSCSIQTNLVGSLNFPSTRDRESRRCGADAAVIVSESHADGVNDERGGLLRGRDLGPLQVAETAIAWPKYEESLGSCKIRMVVAVRSIDCEVWASHLSL